MTICALMLAAKFYQETEDNYVNGDIARLLDISSASKLNSMEAAMVSLLDFNLFVGLLDYNKEASKLNARVVAAKQEEMRQRQLNNVQKKKGTKSKVTSSSLSFSKHETASSDGFDRQTNYCYDLDALFYEEI